MYLSTPPTTDLSRSRLKALVKWVRDDLDILVAREGPNVLRPDDVLTLHETFTALRLSSDVTALDLRATGIHRAVQDIAGVATRWPGRLCDDCDKIITLWQAKFGPFNQLHPFLYGRGGRLEGIASVTEYSREALLKRWSETCPERLHPKRSHQLGDLGFRAGDWWINTLFAYHAGIIGLEAVEGGTTFDKHGAYALVLKDTGEVEASCESNFSYRVPMSDKGKFRLTAATPRSRDPIRVLRSHSINSVWGPKAGVRYEGLFGVKGWSIRQAKTTDTAGGEWKQGDIIFEVRFERQDVVHMDEVTRRPTATEVDDYSEYKRLRKVHRDGKRKGIGPMASPLETDLAMAKVAPPILLPQPSGASGGAKKVRRSSPGKGLSRKSMFRRPHFDLPEAHPHTPLDVVSPMTVPDTDQFPLLRSTLTVPGKPILRPHHQGGSDFSLSGTQQTRPGSPFTGSDANSAHTATSVQSNISEVAPWIDYDASLTIPSPETGLPIIQEKIVSQAGDSQPNALMPRTASNMARNSPPISTRRDRKKSGDFKGMTGYGYLNPIGSSKMKDGRKSIFVRSRNPTAKFFDGVPGKDEEDYFGHVIYRGEDTKTLDTPAPGQKQTAASLSQGQTSVYSPIPRRPFSPDVSVKMTRRGVFYTAENQGETSPSHQGRSPVTFPMARNTYTHTPRKAGSANILKLGHHDPFVEPKPLTPTLHSRLSAALPMSVKNLLSRNQSSPGKKSLEKTSPRKVGVDGGGDARASKRPAQVLSDLEREKKDHIAEEEGKINFTNPFAYTEVGTGSPARRARTRKRRESSGVAPEDVI